MNNDLISSEKDQENLWNFSKRLASSKMVPAIFHNKTEDVFVTIIMGKELGLSPIVALNSICVIQGAVTLKVQTMNSIVRAKCPEAIIEIRIDHAKKEARVLCKRNANDLGYESFWNMEMAKQMNLSTKHNWIAQPMNMLKARALSDSLRAVFPDILMGLYAYEEMEDIDSKPVSTSKTSTMFKEKMAEFKEKNPDIEIKKEEIPKTSDEHKSLVGSIFNLCKIICKDMDSDQKKVWSIKNLRTANFNELETWPLNELIELLDQLNHQNVVFEEEQIEMPVWEEK